MSNVRNAIFSGRRDGNIRCRVVESGECIGEKLKGHEVFCNCLEKSNSGNFVISGESEGAAHRSNKENGGF